MSNTDPKGDLETLIAMEADLEALSASEPEAAKAVEALIDFALAVNGRPADLKSPAGRDWAVEVRECATDAREAIATMTARFKERPTWTAISEESFSHVIRQLDEVIGMVAFVIDHRDPDEMVRDIFKTALQWPAFLNSL